jgi:NitT/TauT family transport system substrate-binding protein
MNRRQALAMLAAGTALDPTRLLAADVIRVSEQPIDASFEVSYAQAQGFTTQAGLNVDIQLMSNGAASMAGVAGGSVDIGNTNIFSALTAHERGVPLVLVAPGSVYNSKTPSSFIMVPKDSNVRSARDLNGKTIAVDGLRNITQYGPMAWADKNGGDAQSLRFVEMPFADMPIALATHRIDAAVIAEPFASRATESRSLASAYDGIGASFLIGGWMATRSWVAANATAAKSFARMIYRTAAWANANHDASAETLVRVAKIDPSNLKTLVRASFAERYDPSMIQTVIDVALKYGAITKPVKPADILASAMPRNA